MPAPRALIGRTDLGDWYDEYREQVERTMNGRFDVTIPAGVGSGDSVRVRLEDEGYLGIFLYNDHAHVDDVGYARLNRDEARNLSAVLGVLPWLGGGDWTLGSVRVSLDREGFAPYHIWTQDSSVGLHYWDDESITAFALALNAAFVAETVVGLTS